MCGDLLAKNDCQLVYAARQGAAHLPLHVVRQRLVGLLQQRPVGPAQGQRDGGKTEGAVAGDVRLDRLHSRRVDHRHIVVYQQLRHNILVGLGGAARQRGVQRRVFVGGGISLASCTGTVSKNDFFINGVLTLKTPIFLFVIRPK